MADLTDVKHKLGLGDDGLAGLGHNIITAPVSYTHLTLPTILLV